MKRRSTILIISGIAIAAIISGVAVATHLRLSAVEGNEEHGNETPQEVINEILTGQPSHYEEGENRSGNNNNNNNIGTNETESKESHSESEETQEERAEELN
jgi:hypothetical protein